MLIAHYKADTRTTELTVTGRNHTDTHTNKQFHSRSPMLKLGPRPPHSILGVLTAFRRAWNNFVSITLFILGAITPSVALAPAR